MYDDKKKAYDDIGVTLKTYKDKDDSNADIGKIADQEKVIKDLKSRPSASAGAALHVDAEGVALTPGYSAYDTLKALVDKLTTLQQDTAAKNTYDGLKTAYDAAKKNLDDYEQSNNLMYLRYTDPTIKQDPYKSQTYVQYYEGVLGKPTPKSGT